MTEGRASYRIGSAVGSPHAISGFASAVPPALRSWCPFYRYGN